MLKIIKTTETQLVELKPENIESGAWISLIRPTADELNEVEDITGAPQDFVRSALDPEESSRIEIEDNHILVLINVPVNHDSNISEYDTLPLGIIITPDYFVTVCQEHNDVIQNFSESRFRYFNTWKRTRFLFQILYRSAMLFLKDLRQMTRRSDQIEQDLRQSMKNAELFQLLDRLLRGGLGGSLFLAGLADAGEALGHILDAVVDILLDIGQGGDGLLQGLLDLIEGLHDVLLDILGRRACVLAQFAQHLAQLAGVLGQLIGPDEHERDDDDDEQLGKSDLHVYTIPFRLLAGQSRLR